ncbi:TPA: hypothetical protein SAP13_004717 [Burkholderia multivorans]|nr:hypothetical protein [Burkholderia multivorans]
MTSNTHKYLINGRLADVLALIQVLALSPKTRRTNEGIMQALRAAPQSASDWIEIGRQHREFFRVFTPEGKLSNVALIARNTQEDLTREDGDSVKPLLQTDVTARLMEMALDMHTREEQQKGAWKTVWVPISVAVLAAIASISAAVITAVLTN